MTCIHEPGELITWTAAWGYSYPVMLCSKGNRHELHELQSHQIGVSEIADAFYQLGLGDARRAEGEPIVGDSCFRVNVGVATELGALAIFNKPLATLTDAERAVVGESVFNVEVTPDEVVIEISRASATELGDKL